MALRTSLLLLMFFALVGCKGADTSLPGDPVGGEEVYTRVCLACHGADGRGNGGLGGDFIGEPHRLQKGNEELLNTIANGVTVNNRVMPPQRDTLTEEERRNALAYIRQQFGTN